MNVDVVLVKYIKLCYLVVFAFLMTYFCRELENVKVFIIYKLTALSSYRRLRRNERGWKDFFVKGLGSNEENKQTNKKQTKKENTKRGTLS